MKTKIILSAILALVFLVASASALIVKNVNTDQISPGEQSRISIEVENTLNEDLAPVSLSLNLANLPFIPIGSSEDSIEEIREGDEETFTFLLKASNTIAPGDYEIPYTLRYEINNTEKTRTGTIGIRVSSQPDLSYSISTENPIVGQKGKVTLKIVNKGFADAQFVSVKVIPEGFTLLSDSDEYIGSIDSDDFETTTFDVIFNKQDANLLAIVEYRNFDNSKITKNVELPVSVYTKEDALKLGLISKSNTLLYVGIIILIIVIWIVWRAIAKRRRLKKSMQRMQEVK
ncbi:MAG: hypothetical protein AABW80_00605 [Nanoarchaeota archaeon]